MAGDGQTQFEHLVGKISSSIVDSPQIASKILCSNVLPSWSVFFLLLSRNGPICKMGRCTRYVPRLCKIT